MPTPPRARLRRLRRRLLGQRRLLAALCAAIAVGAVIRAVSPPAEPTVNDPSPPASLGARLAADHRDLTSLPVRFPDAAMAGLLQVGDRVTLMATSTGPDDATSSTVARDAVVLALPGRPEGATEPFAADGAGRLVVLGVVPDEAAAVTAASIRAVLTFAWGR